MTPLSPAARGGTGARAISTKLPPHCRAGKPFAVENRRMSNAHAQYRRARRARRVTPVAWGRFRTTRNHPIHDGGTV